LRYPSESASSIASPPQHRRPPASPVPHRSKMSQKVTSKDFAKDAVIRRMPREMTYSVSPRHGKDGLYQYKELSVNSSIISFTSKVESLMGLDVPKDIKLTKPKVSVSFAYHTKLEWLGYNGYNIGCVSVPAKFKGKKYTLTLVMWEDLVDPILTGREELGIQKLFINIPEPVWDGNTVTCTLDRYGVPVAEAKATLTKKVADGGVKAKMVNKLVGKIMPKSLHVRDYALHTPSVGGSTAQLYVSPLEIGGLKSVKAGKGSIKFMKLPDEITQKKLLDFLADLKFVGNGKVMAMKFENYLSRMYKNRELPAPAGLKGLFSGGKSFEFIPKTLQCDRLVIECTCDDELRKELFVNSVSNSVTITLSSYEMWGRKQATLRFTIPTADGNFVMTQFDSDDESVYIKREELGAPSCGARLNVLSEPDSMKVAAAWDGTNSGKALKLFHPFKFLEASASGKAEPAAPVVDGPSTLLHHYVMTTVGKWGKYDDDKMITLTETLSNVRDVSGWTDVTIECVTAELMQAPCYSMMYNLLHDLELKPTTATSYSADVALEINQA